MMMRWPLDRLQHAVATALLEPNAALAIAPALTAAGDVSQRLALYRANLQATWEKSLAAVYPVVRTLVGAEFFAALAHSYARAHPSDSGDLNRFGAQFPSFVSAFEHAQALPYLADVATLEWLLHVAHRAGDTQPLGREWAAGLSPQALLAARFSLHPACAWVQSPFPIASIWRAHQPEADVALPEALDRGEFALVVRRQWHGQVLVSRAGEIAALAALRAGADMDDAIAAALYAEPDFNLAKAFVRWLDFELLSELPAASTPE